MQMSQHTHGHRGLQNERSNERFAEGRPWLVDFGRRDRNSRRFLDWRHRRQRYYGAALGHNAKGGGAR